MTQTANTKINNLLPQDKPIHEWYRFVLSYPPHLVRDYLHRFKISSNAIVLDPFCGTGTTLVECKKLGISSIGIEANPMAHFASQTKVDWSIDPDELWARALEIGDSAKEKLRSMGIEEDEVLFALSGKSVRNSLEFRDLSSETKKILINNSISPLPLHKTLILLDQIESHKNTPYYHHLRLASATTAVQDASNLYFGPEIGVGKIKLDAPVINPWLSKIYMMSEDIRQFMILSQIPCEVYLSDARQSDINLKSGSVDFVMTSPPYPNEKDYTRITRLESVLLGFIHDRASLQALKRGLLRSNTRNVYKGDSDDIWINEVASIQILAQTIEARRVELGKTSGFEKLYAKLTKLYFGGMARHLAHLRSLLRPGAHLAYVVGDQASYFRVMIRTGELLGEIAQGLGYELVSIDLFRTRLATSTKEQLREEVVVLRWPG